jgi:hypothetical protein
VTNYEPRFCSDDSCDTCEAYRAGFEAGRAEERAEIVAWLRDSFFESGLMRDPPEMTPLYATDGERAAWYIERGEHKRQRQAVVKAEAGNG